MTYKKMYDRSRLQQVPNDYIDRLKSSGIYRTVYETATLSFYQLPQNNAVALYSKRGDENVFLNLFVSDNKTDKIPSIEKLLATELFIP